MRTLSMLLRNATNVRHFSCLERYRDFCVSYLEYIEQGLQARIVSQNENHYQFFQYGRDGKFNISRPINTNLFCTSERFQEKLAHFDFVFEALKNRVIPDDKYRADFVQVIYTLQQSIGATLDALPAGKSNQARKRNGDLFENLIRLLIQEMGIDCVSHVVQIPVCDSAGNEILKMSYQHDLVVKNNSEIKVLGSVKTSSKDRLDKIFVDKLLFNRLAGKTLPYIAVFLNDIQRKKTKRENQYGVNSTFLSGHFKAYTIRLTPMDGVYYCDIRPNMVGDPFLSQHIRTIDHLFFTELHHWVDG
ncbi:MAG: hypothetical protein WCK89_17830 [bacterium]